MHAYLCTHIHQSELRICTNPAFKTGLWVVTHVHIHTHTHTHSAYDQIDRLNEELVASDAHADALTGEVGLSYVHVLTAAVLFAQIDKVMHK
jgi:hypothetical protein